MAFPEYIPTRTVSVGGAFALETGDPLAVSFSLESTRSLIWSSTGFRFESTGASAQAEIVGGEALLELPRTDLAGWRDASTGAAIDTSAPGSYSHQYHGTLSVGGRTYAIAPFALPAGSGVVDLDVLVSAPGVDGGQVSIPDLWSAQVAAAEAAALAAAASAASGGATPAVIQGFVEDYLIANPMTGASEEYVDSAISNAIANFPTVAPSEIAAAVATYLVENPPSLPEFDVATGLDLENVDGERVRVQRDRLDLIEVAGGVTTSTVELRGSGLETTTHYAGVDTRMAVDAYGVAGSHDDGLGGVASWGLSGSGVSVGDVTLTLPPVGGTIATEAFVAASAPAPSVQATGFTKMVRLSQDDYDLVIPDANTLYFVGQLDGTYVIAFGGDAPVETP